MIKQALIFILFFAPLSVTNAIYTEEQYNKDQILCLANNIYFEGRGEPMVGQIAIGQVVLNRTKNPKFPPTICEVVYQGKYRNMIPIQNQCQFSWWCDGKKETINNPSAFQSSYEIATLVYNGQVMDLSEGALFYHEKGSNPYWAKTRERVLSIDNHIFYK